MAEHCFGGRDAVQPDRRLGKLHVHGRSPSVRKIDPLDRLINLDYVNQYEKIRRALPLRP
jgi:hypothetical protein